MATINETIVAALQIPERGNELHYFSGASLSGKRAPSGFAVRVTAGGVKSFVWFHRVDGKPFLETIGQWAGNQNGGALTVIQAIIKARQRIDDIVTKKADPRPQRTRKAAEGASKSVAAMLDQYVARIRKDRTQLRRHHRERFSAPCEAGHRQAGIARRNP